MTSNKQIQAARRAPVTPVPQGYEYDMIDRFLRNNLHDDDYAEYSAALDELAAAPQPPEAAQSNSAEFDGIKTKAAPVQLPEYDIDTANHAGIRVRGYTQEIVRQLLAAHGIEVAP